MKLCTKCVDTIKQVAPLSYDITIPKADIFQEPVPESECEFWAHRALNQLRKDLQAEENADTF